MDTPRRRNRDANFFEVGVKGRKTGITLKETARDEHGLEIIDGIFSSPAKSPVKTNGSATVRDDTEDLHESSPHLATINRSSRGQFRPPKARSPIKTHLNSPARKRSSVGPAPSSARAENEYYNRAASHPLFQPARDSSEDEPLPSVENSSSATKRRAQVQGKSSPTTQARRAVVSHNLRGHGASEAAFPRPKQRKLFQTRPREIIEDEESLDNVDMLLGPEDNDGPDFRGDGGSDSSFSDREAVSAGQLEDDNQVYSQQNDTIIEEEEPPPQRAKPKPKQATRAQERSPPLATSTAVKRGRGRPPKPRAIVEEVHNRSEGEEGEQEIEEEEEEAEEEEEEIQPPPKKAKRARQGKSKEAARPPPSQRPANAKISSAKKGRGAASKSRPVESSGRSQRSEEDTTGAAAQRSNWHARHQTPTEDIGVQTTRSGRTSLKPLAYWRNERVVYGGGNKSKGVLPTIQEVVRTDEVEAPRRPRAGPKAGKVRSKTSRAEADEKLEPWELDPGFISGEVGGWDQERAIGDRSKLIETGNISFPPWQYLFDLLSHAHVLPMFLEIAYSTTAIETREVANSTFRYSKILTTPFFGAGLVDVPPGGVKRPKNSRKMQLVFFVFYGRVLVDVAGTRFQISKGGMWQVPRGQ
ncbi:MAG: hypothetical protein M4579_004764 [Chaenotheca gracillima]|nr:MAG: hypothetical protein M4579_004764 [Chaenotheca gracillima]